MIPHGTPPPAYTHLQPSPPPENIPDNHSFPPPSPTLSELEIQTFGHRLPIIPTHSTRSNSPPAEDVEVITQPASAPTRGHKRKATQSQTKAADTSSNAEAPAPVFELLVEVPQPDKKTKTTGRSKAVKVEPWKFGPKNVGVDITWEAFLGLVAELSSASVPSLVTSSFTWKFLTPKNSPNLPLSSVDGHKSFIGQVQARIQKSGSAYVVLTMHKPLANQSAPPPWATTSVNTAAHNPTEFDQGDELSDNDSGAQIKRARFDDDLESLIEEIKEKYPVGLCSVHPTLACFHHKVNNLHFDLGSRARCLVWAAAIRDKKASLTQIPLGSNFFKADQALKPSKRASEPDVTPESKAPSTPAPRKLEHHHHAVSDGALHPYQHMPFPYYSPYHMPPPQPFFPPYPFPNQPFSHGHHANQYTHSTPSRSVHSQAISFDDARSSSPPMAPPDFDVEEFCKTYQLDAKACAALQGMGFAGDSLEGVPSNEWKDQGLGFLEWQRILNAVKKYKRDLRK